MRIIVLDKDREYIETLNGTFLDGVFHWKEGASKILRWSIGGKERTIPLIYDETAYINDDREGVVIYDGKNYEQVQHAHGKPSLKDEHDIKKQLSDRDYSLISQICDLTIDKQIPQNDNFKEIIEWLTLIALAIVALTTYFGAHNLQLAATNIMKPLNMSLQQNAALIKMLENQTKQLYAAYNRTH